MTAVRMIHAEGFNWPLDLYVDAFRFVRVDADEVPEIDGDPELICISGAHSGVIRLQPKRFASAIDWQDTIAFRALDHVSEIEPCFSCGTSVDPDDMCERCLNDAEYD